MRYPSTLALLLLLGALPAPSPRTSVPSIEKSACAVPVAKNERTDCYMLTVPEDRSAHDGKTIRFPVVLFHSRSVAPKSDPVIFTEGGPGNSTIRDVRSGRATASLDDRDFIVFEQRGSTYGEPHLTCPEMNAIDNRYSDENLTFQQAVRLQVKAALVCRERLTRAGIDVRAYNTAAIADDVADLASALHLQNINLMGLSYSTALFMEVVRRHPGLVRSVVLDSVMPIDSRYDEVANANVLRSLHQIFDSCAVDPICSRTYPGLETAFQALVVSLNAKPLHVRLKSTKGQVVPYAVSGRNLVEGIYGVALQDADAIRDVPHAIWQAHRGDFREVLAYVQSNMGGPDYSYGARLSVLCHDFVAFESADRIVAQATLAPALGGMNAANLSASVCNAWRSGRADATQFTPVRSDVPVLVFAGAFDPNTPPQWGQQVRRTLPNSYFIEFPAAVHDAGLDSRCGLSLAAAFFDNPTMPPYLPCLARLRPPTFRLQ
jgi:pimeloyl-ACP methyl ester carboxylesterase